MFSQLLHHLVPNLVLTSHVYRERIVVDPVVQHLQGVRKITYDFNFDSVVFVNFRRYEVEVNDFFLTVGIPELRWVFDHVVSNPADSLSGLGIVALGVPVYYLWTRYSEKEVEPCG